ncbi:uncharacterized protein LOC134502401 [Candoia aspera]|uniref:uncharacterized protein LOC134502401 n=1 Tax=Candoia aspera TaxID=51853 RepID=UPI002FD7BC7B
MEKRGGEKAQEKRGKQSSSAPLFLPSSAPAPGSESRRIPGDATHRSVRGARAALFPQQPKFSTFFASRKAPGRRRRGCGHDAPAAQGAAVSPRFAAAAGGSRGGEEEGPGLARGEPSGTGARAERAGRPPSSLEEKRNAGCLWTGNARNPHHLAWLRHFCPKDLGLFLLSHHAQIVQGGEGISEDISGATPNIFKIASVYAYIETHSTGNHHLLTAVGTGNYITKQCCHKVKNYVTVPNL